MIKINALYTFFARLPKREKRILYVVAFLVSLILLERLVINPIYSKMQSLDKEIREKELDIKKSLRILAQKDKISLEIKKYASISNSLKSEQEDVTPVLKEIESLANKSSVYLVDMKPAGLKSSGSTKKYLINLECEAQMEQLTEFMYNIENSNKLLSIEKYQISPKSKESSIATCSMAIAKIIML